MSAARPRTLLPSESSKRPLVLREDARLRLFLAAHAMSIYSTGYYRCESFFFAHFFAHPG